MCFFIFRKKKTLTCQAAFINYDNYNLGKSFGAMESQKLLNFCVVCYKI